jgi:methylenetetrahydrofolate dehydrogenase (NADP+)/methenyltetrahydrofolate cyclohydrolase
MASFEAIIKRNCTGMASDCSDRSGPADAMTDRTTAASVSAVSTPRILDGKALSQAVARSTKRRAEAVAEKIGRKPGLAVILVGENPASKTYVASKTKLATQSGLAVFDAYLPATTTADELSKVIEDYNNDERVDGILLQLPLPAPLDGATFVREIDSEKDADGLHPTSQGLLLQGAKGPRSCTPLGVMALLDLALSGLTITDTLTMDDIPRASLAGKSAVVIGRSQLVGKPISFLLLERNATVTMAHSKTADLAAVCRSADIVVAAVGVPNLVKRDWVKPGAIVLDVGINRLPDGKLTGDVAFDELKDIASAITPVPGGVGPMTVAMLISNTVDNCYWRTGAAMPGIDEQSRT